MALNKRKGRKNQWSKIINLLFSCAHHHQLPLLLQFLFHHSAWMATILYWGAAADTDNPVIKSYQHEFSSELGTLRALILLLAQFDFTRADVAQAKRNSLFFFVRNVFSSSIDCCMASHTLFHAITSPHLPHSTDDAVLSAHRRGLIHDDDDILFEFITQTWDVSRICRMSFVEWILVFISIFSLSRAPHMSSQCRCRCFRWWAKASRTHRIRVYTERAE